ncbi:MAG: hypothetical protein RJA35_490 [Actinomycetota bacterium]|jgi:predicted transcriptional regulator
MATRNRNQGELETAVLGVLWDAPEGSALSSQEILERVASDGSLALTTVLTVLSRLSDKGLVERHQSGGRSLRFKASTTRAQHDAQLLLKVFEGSQNPLLAFSHFAQSLNAEQLAQLRQSLSQK